MWKSLEDCDFNKYFIYLLIIASLHLLKCCLREFPPSIVHRLLWGTKSYAFFKSKKSRYFTRGNLIKVYFCLLKNKFLIYKYKHWKRIVYIELNKILQFKIEEERNDAMLSHLRWWWIRITNTKILRKK